MLCIKNINIQFHSKYILEQTDFYATQNSLTVISGESGCGKSSLLNVIGLLSTRFDSYSFNDQVISPSNFESFKQNYISYIPQNGLSIKNYTIKDLFIMYFNIANRPFSFDFAKELLELVNLSDIKLSQKCKSLSGGESQRLSIALSLVKQPKILLLDEPTAYLDSTNSQNIVELLHRIKLKNIAVIVVSHKPEIYQPDFHYRIEDNQLAPVQSAAIKEESTKIDCIENMNRHFNQLRHIFVDIKAHRLSYLLILGMIVVGMYFLLSVVIQINSYKTELITDYEAIYTDEVLITNMYNATSENAVCWNVGAYKFSDIDIQKITDTQLVNSIYPYYCNCYGWDDIYDLSGNFIDWVEEFYIFDIAYNNQKVNTYLDMGNIITFCSCDEENEKNRCLWFDSTVENGIIISYELANQLGIDSLDHTEITLTVPTIIGNVEAYKQTMNGHGEFTSEPITTYDDIIILTTETFPVKGVYEKTLAKESFYDDLTGCERIYMDYHLYESRSSSFINNSELMDTITRSFQEETIFEPAIATSTYVARIDKENIDEFKELMLDKIPYAGIKTKNDVTDQSISFYNKMLLSLSTQPLIMLGVISLLISLNFIYFLYERKKEISLLGLNGIQFYKYIPSLSQWVIYGMSIPCTILLFVLLENFQTNFNPYNSLIKNFKISVLVMAFVVIILCLLSFVINYFYYKKLNVVDEIRN